MVLKVRIEFTSRGEEEGGRLGQGPRVALGVLLCSVI